LVMERDVGDIKKKLKERKDDRWVHAFASVLSGEAEVLDVLDDLGCESFEEYETYRTLAESAAGELEFARDLVALREFLSGASCSTCEHWVPVQYHAGRRVGSGWCMLRLEDADSRGVCEDYEEGD